jgi:DNA polymerase III sliding clamp (beta) subunit (PCNA family)
MEENKAITMLDVKSDALAELLTGTLTHVLPAREMLAALNSVALEVSEGKLIARATDRYRLIEGSVETTGELAHSLVSESDVKKILTLLKEYKVPVNVTISRAADLLSVSVLGHSITIRIDDYNYPTLIATNGLLTYELPREPIGEIKFNPKFFSDYAKIMSNDKNKPVALEFRADNKPIDIKLVGIKVEWRALLMPMRTK